jgi:hypothetical protein|eukprot:SAG25_NODE_320_length_9927_cov_18.459402_17_plen_171_part_00
MNDLCVPPAQWEQEHADQLEIGLDTRTESKVLISTRMRGLCGPHAVEIVPPSPDESIAILMAAAGMTGKVVPEEAAEVVAICSSLPLALAMAGRLISDLGIEDNWDGVTELLRDELTQTSSAEQHIIRASLGSLPGTERDKVSITTLFKLFAMVPGARVLLMIQTRPPAR